MCTIILSIIHVHFIWWKRSPRVPCDPVSAYTLISHGNQPSYHRSVQYLAQLSSITCPYQCVLTPSCSAVSVLLWLSFRNLVVQHFVLRCCCMIWLETSLTYVRRFGWKCRHIPRNVMKRNGELIKRCAEWSQYIEERMVIRTMAQGPAVPDEAIHAVARFARAVQLVVTRGVGVTWHADVQ